MLLFDVLPIEDTQNTPLSDLLRFFPIGYLITVLIETTVLIFGLTAKLSLKQKILCGLWLTACTYPIVVLVLPMLFYGSSRAAYLFVAESFAHFGECVIFWLAFKHQTDFTKADWMRSFIAILAANFLSFTIGEILNFYNWFGVF